MASHPTADLNEAAKIAAAIRTAQSYMLAGDPVSTAIADAAQEAGLLPRLLQNRFKLACEHPKVWLTKVRRAARAVAPAEQVNVAEVRMVKGVLKGPQ